MYNVRSRWLLAALAFALLPACGKNDHTQSAATASSTPAKTVLTTIHLFKNGQFDALLQHVLTPSDYKRMRAEWKAQRAKAKQISEHDRERFAQGMARLTAPDADQKIWAQLEPKLKQSSQKIKSRLPMMIGVFALVANTKISNSKQLDADQKKQASDVVNAFGSWAQNVPWTDPGRLKKAIGVVTSSARKLDLKTLDQAVALSYSQAVKKYSIAWNGVKQILGIYDFSVDKTLDSATAKTVRSDAHTATVKVNMTLFGKPLVLTANLVKIDNRWYDKDLLDHWHKLLEQHQPASASSTAPVSAASTAPAAASSTR